MSSPSTRRGVSIVSPPSSHSTASSSLSSLNSTSSLPLVVDPTTKTPLENEQYEQTIIALQDFWDVVAPAPSTSVKGQFVKGVFKTMGKSRRISLEIHRIPIPKIPSGLDIESDSDSDSEEEDAEGDESFVEKAFLRLSKRKSNYKPSSRIKHGSSSTTSFLEDDASSVVSGDRSYVDFPDYNTDTLHHYNDVGGEMFATPLAAVDEHTPYHSQQQGTGGGNAEFHFDNETLQAQQLENRRRLGLSTVVQQDKWYTKYKIELSNIQIHKHIGNVVTLRIREQNSGEYNEEREIHFNSSHEAWDFVQKLNQLTETDNQCRIRNYDRAVRGLDISSEDMDKKIHFLIEIVGAEKLVVSDIKSSDPFVIAKFGNKEIHRTKYISKNLNPIWTLRQKAFFILTVSPRELFTNLHGLNFIIYDYDVGGNDILGAASLPPKTLFLANEERLEMELKPMIIGKKVFPKVAQIDPHIGTLAIRARRATEYDINFMSSFQAHPKKGTLKSLPQAVKNNYAERIQKQKGPTLIKTVITNYKKTFKDDRGNKIEKYKVRPCPDPENSIEWMTSGEIDAEVMKKSRTFKCLGAGGIAKLHLEILSCDDLPNLENIQLFGNKTDAFVQIVYEDSIGETCTIYDSNSPRWMPWTNRAFTLHTRYPSSVIYIGVHDYDSGADMISDHDLVGRCAVDVSNLKPNTEYLLDYAIHNTSMSLERKRQGSLKIRLRMEIDDPRAYLLASFNIPPPIYVNTKRAKKFQCLRHTINGDYDVTEYSLQTIIMLVREILQNKRVIHYAKRIIADSFFWRPIMKFVVRVPWFVRSDEDRMIESDSLLDKYTAEKDIFIPFNSIVVFLAGIMVVEHPRLLPSVSFFSLGWLLITTKNFRDAYPNPWWRNATFTEMCLMLLLGKNATVSPEKIDVNQSAELAKATDQYWENMIEEEEKKGLRIRMEIAEEQQELEKDLLEAKGDADDISTKVANVSLDPLIIVKPYVYPVQLSLIQLCNFLRFVKNVLQWEESHYSFFLTLSSFLLAVIFIFLPWVFIFRWFARILVWVLLGPWMRLLDPTRKKKLSVEDTNAQETINRLKRKMDRDKTLSHARIQNENARKYRDFKMYFFGKYLTRVPVFRIDRYLDLPLASSSAVPIEKKTMTFGELAIEESGGKDYEISQQLVGVMIPKVRQVEPSTDAPTGQPAKQKSMIKMGELGADVDDDSALIVYAKLGSLAVFAAVISYILVPVMIRIFQNVLRLMGDNQEL